MYKVCFHYAIDVGHYWRASRDKLLLPVTCWSAGPAHRRLTSTWLLQARSGWRRHVTVKWAAIMSQSDRNWHKWSSLSDIEPRPCADVTNRPLTMSPISLILHMTSSSKNSLFQFYLFKDSLVRLKYMILWYKITAYFFLRANQKSVFIP